MAPFPCPLERTVASALLLLSVKPTSFSPPKSYFNRELMTREGKEKKSISEDSLSLVFSESKLCSLALTSDGSSQEIQASKLRIIAVAAPCHEMKLQVVQKSRSKLCRSADHGKVTAIKQAAKHSSASESTEASCLSSSSSAVSSARSRYVIRAEKRDAMAREELRKKHGIGSAQIHRRAEAILILLSGSCSSEVNIRQVLGDSPDTSKALRMLLKLEEIKRSGTGGRQDPYIYTIA